MKKLSQLLLVLFVGGVLLSGCGQTGSLYLTQSQQDEVDAEKAAIKAKRDAKIEAAKAAKAAECVEATEGAEVEMAEEGVDENAEVVEGIAETADCVEVTEDAEAAEVIEATKENAEEVVEEVTDEQPVVTE